MNSAFFIKVPQNTSVFTSIAILRLVRYRKHFYWRRKWVYSSPKDFSMKFLCIFPYTKAIFYLFKASRFSVMQLGSWIPKTLLTGAPPPWDKQIDSKCSGYQRIPYHMISHSIWFKTGSLITSYRCINSVLCPAIVSYVVSMLQ